MSVSTPAPYVKLTEVIFLLRQHSNYNPNYYKVSRKVRDQLQTKLSVDSMLEYISGLRNCSSVINNIAEANKDSLSCIKLDELIKDKELFATYGDFSVEFLLKNDNFYVITIHNPPDAFTAVYDGTVLYCEKKYERLVIELAKTISTSESHIMNEEHFTNLLAICLLLHKYDMWSMIASKFMYTLEFNSVMETILIAKQWPDYTQLARDLLKNDFKQIRKSYMELDMSVSDYRFNVIEKVNSSICYEVTHGDKNFVIITYKGRVYVHKHNIDLLDDLRDAIDANTVTLFRKNEDLLKASFLLQEFNQIDAIPVNFNNRDYTPMAVAWSTFSNHYDKIIGDTELVDILNKCNQQVVKYDYVLGDNTEFKLGKYCLTQSMKWRNNRVFTVQCPDKTFRICVTSTAIYYPSSCGNEMQMIISRFPKHAGNTGMCSEDIISMLRDAMIDKDVNTIATVIYDNIDPDTAVSLAKEMERYGKTCN